MDIETKIKKAVTKAKQIFCFGQYKELVNLNPTITFTLVGDELLLNGISFIYYDQLVITNKHICYMPYKGTMQVLLTYNSIDEFIEKDFML